MFKRLCISNSVHCRLTVFLLQFCWLISGCGGTSDAPATIPVSGTLKSSGTELTNGTINFVPVNISTSRPAQAAIQKDGTFETPPGKGLMVGEYKISINSHIRPLHEIHPEELAKLGDSVFAVPKKYMSAETSELTLTVTEDDSSKQLDLDLK